MAGQTAFDVARAESRQPFRLLRLEQQIARWQPQSDGRVAVTYALVDRNMTFDTARNCPGLQAPEAGLQRYGLTREAFATEVRAATRQWEQVADIRFVETDDVAAANLLIGAQTSPVGRAFTNVELTKSAQGEPRSIARALICLNPEMRWKIGFDGDLDVYDLRYTIAHELGHAIGLDHPGGNGQVMGFRYTEAFAELQAGDIAGAVALYGAARTARHADSDAQQIGNVVRADMANFQIPAALLASGETNR